MQVNKTLDPRLESLLQASAARHSHLCPRQVLGVRVGLAGLSALRLASPVKNKRLLVIVETDGCFTDGIEVSTGAAIGHRTLRVEDYGKAAATFIDTLTGESIRIAAHPQARERAWDYVSADETRHYFAQLSGYQVMPAEQLLCIQPVSLATPLEAILSHPGVRASCSRCGEEIINERQVIRDGETLCIACSGQAYYFPHSGENPHPPCQS